MNESKPSFLECIAIIVFVVLCIWGFAYSINWATNSYAEYLKTETLSSLNPDRILSYPVNFEAKSSTFDPNCDRCNCRVIFKNGEWIVKNCQCWGCPEKPKKSTSTPTQYIIPTNTCTIEPYPIPTVEETIYPYP